MRGKRARPECGRVGVLADVNREIVNPDSVDPSTDCRTRIAARYSAASVR